MDRRHFARIDDVAEARLLIHVAADDDNDGWGVDSFIQRLRRRWLGKPCNECALAALEIEDLRGCRVLALEDLSPLVEVALPPGTYHVSTHLAGTQRRYTVVLERGRPVDLYLNLGRTRH